MNGYLGDQAWDRLLADFILRLGWTCYHSLWQGLIVAGSLWILLHTISRYSSGHSNLRYWVSLLAFIAMPVLGLGTFLGTEFGPARTTDISDGASRILLDRYLNTISLHESVPVLYDLRSWIEGFLPAIGILWPLGFLISAIRLSQGWLVARRLVSGARSSADPTGQVRMERLRDAMKIPGPVRLLMSDSINTPAVVGWLNPVILWPASAMAGMSPQGVNALMAHELAHIRRFDFVVNVVQSIIDAVYFYHPAAWWISRQVRLEREHCADDLAVQVLENCCLGTRVVYGQTLLNLEEYRPSQAFTIRATGGFLLPRIRRITGQKEPRVSLSRFFAGLLMIAAVIVLQSSIGMAVKPISDDAQGNPGAGPSRTEPSTSSNPRNDSTVVTEPIAQAIVARLSARNIDTDALRAVRDGMWEAIRRGKPLVLEQVHAILIDHGYDQNTLHAPADPVESGPASNEPTWVTEPIAQAIIARLSARNIDTDALRAVRDGMWEAIREGSPWRLEQVHAILGEYGYEPSILHSPSER